MKHIENFENYKLLEKTFLSNIGASIQQIRKIHNLYRHDILKHDANLEEIRTKKLALSMLKSNTYNPLLIVIDEVSTLYIVTDFIGRSFDNKKTWNVVSVSKNGEDVKEWNHISFKDLTYIIPKGNYYFTEDGTLGDLKKSKREKNNIKKREIIDTYIDELINSSDKFIRKEFITLSNEIKNKIKDLLDDGDVKEAERTMQKLIVSKRGFGSFADDKRVKTADDLLYIYNGRNLKHKLKEMISEKIKHSDLLKRFINDEIDEIDVKHEIYDIIIKTIKNIREEFRK
jgi:predicted Zn-dependent protease with MMP-like domain